MKCPICNVDLLITDRQGIEIDYCPKCRGIWLDRGELDKIIDRSIAINNPDDRDFKISEKNEYYYKKRKKSFLGELFDFD